MSAVRRAPCLSVFTTEVDSIWPARQRGTDGWLSDDKHKPGSAHRPENSVDGVTVRAQDITQSAPYLDTNTLADHIAANIMQGIEKRVEGIGSWNVKTRSERWFAYRDGIWSWIDQDLNGASHEGHMHLQIKNTLEAFNDLSPWNLSPHIYTEEIVAEHLFQAEGTKGIYWLTDGRLIPLGDMADVVDVNKSRMDQGLKALAVQSVRPAFLDRLK